MKTVGWILAIIILGFCGYYAFYIGLALLKIFIGLCAIGILALGIIIGRISKS
jgi:hypothetical protein